jgi:predicted transport protein
MNQFNAQMVDSRDKFNAQMQFAVDQSNVAWRREINTLNTATQNETNRLNAQMQYNATQNALNNLWQQYRDNAAWNFQKSENVLQRQHETATIAMQLANQQNILNQQQKNDLAKNLGKWLGNIAIELI